MPHLVRLTLVLALSLAVAAPAAAEESGGLLRGTLGKLLGDRPLAEAQEDAPAAAQVVPESREQVQLSFAPIVRKVAKSVVNVYAARNVVERSPFAGDPFFERFFGPEGFGLPRQRRQQSLGSGVIVSAEGVIVTNNHVIENMDEIKVALTDGREFECEVVLRDAKSDLAVLKVSADVRLEPIEIGDSDQVEVGDLVLAIGNPFGVGQTVTSGIVSAVSRSLRGVNDYGYFIQTDAAINRGNSGGALVDMNGRLIGINTAIFSPSGGSVGLGYAIPANMTKVILRSARTGDAVVRPWLGADFQTVNAEIAESIGLERPIGAIVTSVVDKGPAAAAGLAAGDVVVEVNGQSVDSADMLGYRLDTAGLDTRAELTVISRGERRTIEVKLEPAPETVPREEIELPAQSPLGGLRVANLSPAVAVELGLPGDKTGVAALSVARNSPADAGRMRPGDIIRQVNGVDITSTRDLERILSRRLRTWQFVVEREGRFLIIERDGPLIRQFLR
ncbi:MAG: protease [Alphaproteobacteria bacterium]|nr:MAG: protease [Alphaproteobacteria bacterium]